MFDKVLDTDAIIQRCSVKKVFLENSQNLLEHTFARVTSCSFIIRGHMWPMCFSKNFVKF